MAQYTFRVKGADDSTLRAESRGASTEIAVRHHRNGTQSFSLTLQSGGTTIVYSGTPTEHISSLLYPCSFQLRVSDSYGRQYRLAVERTTQDWGPQDPNLTLSLERLEG
jgi:hypothetical protein